MEDTFELILSFYADIPIYRHYVSTFSIIFMSSQQGYSVSFLMQSIKNETQSTIDWAILLKYVTTRDIVLKLTLFERISIRIKMIEVVIGSRNILHFGQPALWCGSFTNGKPYHRHWPLYNFFQSSQLLWDVVRHDIILYQLHWM